MKRNRQNWESFRLTSGDKGVGFVWHAGFQYRKWLRDTGNVRIGEEGCRQKMRNGMQCLKEMSGVELEWSVGRRFDSIPNIQYGMPPTHDGNHVSNRYRPRRRANINNKNDGNVNYSNKREEHGDGF